jgi:phosphoenolpyruvate carboxylase
MRCWTEFTSNGCSLLIRPTQNANRFDRSCGRFRRFLAELDLERLTPQEESDARLHLQAELIKLWQTVFIRPSRPTVLNEVERGLSFQPVIWSTVPQIKRELRSAINEINPKAVQQLAVKRIANGMRTTG